eukprot:6185533-Pleurochrysis_carterae.AAC.3
MARPHRACRAIARAALTSVPRVQADRRAHALLQRTRGWESAGVDGALVCMELRFVRRYASPREGSARGEGVCAAEPEEPLTHKRFSGRGER